MVTTQKITKRQKYGNTAPNCREDKKSYNRPTKTGGVKLIKTEKPRCLHDKNTNLLELTNLHLVFTFYSMNHD